MSAGGAQTEQMGQARQAGRVSTAALSVLVALGVIAVLAAAEYSIPRWLHPGAGDSGSFFSNKDFSNKDSAPNPSGPRSASGPSIQPEPAGNTEAGHRNGRASTPESPAMKSLGCQPGDSSCWDRKARSMPPRQSAHPDSNSEASASASQQNPPPPQTGRQPPASAQDASAAEQNIRTMEDATAHLVALEREEFDHLSNRARALNGRIEEAERQQPAPARQLRDDWAFSQQRLQSHLNRADNALKSADVQTAKKFLDQAKTELEKLANLLAGQ